MSDVMLSITLARVVVHTRFVYRQVSFKTQQTVISNPYAAVHPLPPPSPHHLGRSCTRQSPAWYWRPTVQHAKPRPPLCARLSLHSTLLLCPAVCTAPSRLFVHEAIYDQFLDRVLQLTKKR